MQNWERVYLLPVLLLKIAKPSKNDYKAVFRGFAFYVELHYKIAFVDCVAF